MSTIRTIVTVPPPHTMSWTNSVTDVHSYRDGVHLTRCACGWFSAKVRLRRLAR